MGAKHATANYLTCCMHVTVHHSFGSEYRDHRHPADALTSVIPSGTCARTQSAECEMNARCVRSICELPTRGEHLHSVLPRCWYKDPATGEVYVLPLWPCCNLHQDEKLTANLVRNVPGLVPSVRGAYILLVGSLADFGSLMLIAHFCIIFFYSIAFDCSKFSIREDRNSRLHVMELAATKPRWRKSGEDGARQNVQQTCDAFARFCK